MALFRIGIADHNAYWPQVAPLFERSTEYGLDWSVADVKRLLDDGSGHLWIVADGDAVIGAWVTKICIGRQRYAEISDLAGERFDEWMAQGDAVLTQWAKDMDCKAIRFYGRAGWAKKLASIGYKVIRIEGIKHVKQNAES